MHSARLAGSVRSGTPSYRNSPATSNGNVARQEGWTPLTESTFDSGLIVESQGGHYVCIWFEDED